MTDLALLPEVPKLDARIPRWELRSRRERGCPVCRRAAVPPLRRRDGLPVSHWSDHRPKALDASGARAIEAVAPARALSDLKIRRLSVLTGGLAGRLVLEVGAGRGEFLAAVRHAGARVVANGISGEACAFLEGALRIPVVRGDLAHAEWTIVVNDPLERPIDPFRLLSRAVRLLRPGGRLVISTQNGGAAGHDATSAAELVGFRVDLERLQYFSARTIQVLAGVWGLQIEHLETTGYPALEGIDRLPGGAAKPARDGVGRALRATVRLVAPWIPEARRVAREIRHPRCAASHHLFAIVSKP